MGAEKLARIPSASVRYSVQVRWRGVLAGMVLLAAFLMIQFVGPFPRALIVVPGFIVWLISSRRDVRFSLGIAFALIAVATLFFNHRAAHTEADPSTNFRGRLALSLYDTNCSAPFPTGRYPRTVMWLADGDLPHRGSWVPVLTCRSRF